MQTGITRIIGLVGKRASATDEPDASIVQRVRLVAVTLLLGLVAGCSSLPPLEQRSVTTALTDTGRTVLGRAVTPLATAHPGSTGVHLLNMPRDAFAARVLLARAAERSLDVQYYIWHGDESGYLLMEALVQAADRGVRVRLLLDDLNTGGLEDMIGALVAHPNVELRLYNPFVQRDARALGFITDFARLNRRMHNKSFTADNQVAIVGGRNIGNEYLGAGTGVAFVDLDLLVIGAAVGDVSVEFDRYWNSASAYPAAMVAGARDAADAARLEARFVATHRAPEAVTYLDAVRSTPLIGQLLDQQLGFEWARAQLLYDDPAKTLDEADRADLLLFPELVQRIGQPEATLDLVTPYFVPGAAGTAALIAAVRRGVRVRVLTNSLAASDVAAVHAGYARRRADLLRGGVRLYELKPWASVRSAAEEATGASAPSALHAKTFAVDGKRVFVGSFNFDQRSMHLNTEMGLVIESAPLARQLAGFFDRDVPRLAYEVRLGEDGNLTWIERTSAGEAIFDLEPQTTAARRLKVQLLSILPIEWLL